MKESSLGERVQKDMVAAMKARDNFKVGVLRLVKAALQNKQIELRGKLSTEQENQVLVTLVKQRNEAIEVYERAGRFELVDKETAERELITAYLPERVSDEEVARVVDAVISELEASTAKDIGAVMKETLARLKSTGKTVDGKSVNAVVRAKLS
ncbi:MAG TPA: GatB/YqeY domain-containing protein [Vicinamibacteria bacterium]|nr:GatB/YqeY domain-containing protein [Vicinamibacteria bacterium]